MDASKMSEEELSPWIESEEGQKRIHDNVKYVWDRHDWLNARLRGLAIMAACALAGTWALYIIAPVAALIGYVWLYERRNYPRAPSWFDDLYSTLTWK